MEPAGFDPAMKRHVTTPLSLSATLQYACGHRSRKIMLRIIAIVSV